MSAISLRALSLRTTIAPYALQYQPTRSRPTRCNSTLRAAVSAYARPAYALQYQPTRDQPTRYTSTLRATRLRAPMPAYVLSAYVLAAQYRVTRTDLAYAPTPQA
eukprot:3670117-Rhodomonas_salina.1